jgi:hypothetical protein
MSCGERLLLPNMEMNVARLEPGPGMFVLAALWLAVRESVRPSGTFQVGPPSCIDQRLQSCVAWAAE